MSEKIKLALIGYGYWGPNFLRIAQNSENALLVSVCDINQAKYRHVTDKYPNVTFTDNIENIVNDKTIDGVIICTPVSTHFNLARKILASGKHVLCEKPLSDNYKNCILLSKVASETTESY